MKRQIQIENYRKYLSFKHLLVVALILLLTGNTQSLHAQIKDTIGTGTTATNSYGPCRVGATVASSMSTKVIHLYTQSDLAAIGIFPGAVISSIAWQKATAGNLLNGNSVKLNISLRSQIDSLAYGTGVTSTILINNYVGSNFTFAGTKTFSATGTNLPADTFWVAIDFSAPYTYSGGGLEVLTEGVFTAGSGAPAAAALNWRYTSNTMNKCIYTNSATAYNSTAVCNLSTYRPNAIFTYTAGPSCSGTPVVGTIKMETTQACPGMFSGNLLLKGASAATGIKLQWEMKEAAQSTFTPIPGETGYELFNQQITTATDYRVIITCGTNKSTSTVVTMNPTPFIIPDYKQDFETNASWFSLTIPGCLQTRKGILEAPVVFLTTTSNATGYAYGGWTSDGWKNVGTWGAARLTTNKDLYDWLLTPGINLGTGNWQLEFDLGIFTTGTNTPGILDGDDFIAVVISTDGGKTWTQNSTLQRWDSAQVPLSPDGTKHIVLPLTRYSGNVVIGFYATGGGLVPIAPAKVSDIMIDNIQIVTSCTPKMPATITGPVTVCRNGLASYSVPTVSGVNSYTWILPSGWTGSSTTNSIAVKPNDANGTVWVVANTATCGSSDTQKLNVLVSRLPIITPEMNLVACAGDSVRIESSSANSYQWLQGNSIIANATDRVLVVTQKGDYRVLATNGACSDTSGVRSVSFNPLPVPAIVHNDNILSVSQDYIDYQWYFNGTAIAGEVYPQYVVRDSGVYYVTVTDSNGCIGTSEGVTVKGGNSTGIDAAHLDKAGIQIYPNPAQDVLYIAFAHELKGDEKITILNIAGKVLQSEKVNGKKVTVNMSSLSAGIYLIKISSAETILVSKVTKH